MQIYCLASASVEQLFCKYCLCEILPLQTVNTTAENAASAYKYICKNVVNALDVASAYE